MTIDYLRSSCRAREAAFGRAAVVKSDNAFLQANHVHRIGEDFVLERSLAGSAAATRGSVKIADFYYVTKRRRGEKGGVSARGFPAR